MTATAVNNLRVLYVEDDPVLRDMFSTKLRRLSMIHTVVPCANAREALGVTRGGTFDIAVLDLNLGETQINGVDLGLALRAVLRGLPIVILSQYAVPRLENVVPVAERYDWSFVQKHGRFDIIEFAAVIERTMRGEAKFETGAGRAAAETSPLARLSRRQRQVMALASAGYDAKAIAGRLSLAHVSVRRELSNAYRVLVPDPEEGTDLRTVAVLEYIRLSGGADAHGAVPDPL